MTKENATLKKLGTWDEFVGKSSGDAAQAMYQHAATTYTTVADWYWDSIGDKRNTALITRALTMLLVIGATIMQTLATIDGDPAVRLRHSQYVLAMLAVAGLVQLADRVFGWSSGWTRYVTTATAIEVRTRQLQRDWNSAMLVFTVPLQPDNTRALYELIKCYEADILKAQADETQTWAAEFNNGSAILGDAITTLRGQNKDTFNRNPASPVFPWGALQLIFETLPAQQLSLPLLIAIDGQPAQSCNAKCWVGLLAPGPHTIMVSSSSNPPQRSNFVVVIGANATISQTVNLA
jgi:hypothetical protein